MIVKDKKSICINLITEETENISNVLETLEHIYNTATQEELTKIHGALHSYDIRDIQFVMNFLNEIEDCWEILIS